MAFVATVALTITKPFQRLAQQQTGCYLCLLVPASTIASDIKNDLVHIAQDGSGTSKLVSEFDVTDQPDIILAIEAAHADPSDTVPDPSTPNAVGSRLVAL